MQRPFISQEENTTTIISNNNSLVKDNDLLIIVGDVFNKEVKPSYIDNLKYVNGKKVLIRGNHDTSFSNKELEKYFDLIIDEGNGLDLEVDCVDSTLKCWATHYPSLARTDRFNLVGHIHSAWKFQLNSLNVGVDCNHFFPH